MNAKKSGRKLWSSSSPSTDIGWTPYADRPGASMLPFKDFAGLPVWPGSVHHSLYKKGNWFEHQNYSFCALEIPLEGNLRFVQRDTASVVGPGSVYIIHQGADAFMETGPAGFCRKVAVTFGGALVSNIFASLALSFKLEVKLKKPEAFLESVLALERLLRAKREEDIPDIAALSLKILMQLAAEAGERLPEKLAKALNLMAVNLSRPIPISKIASELTMSASALDRLFLRVLGESPKRRYLKLRLEKAASLLSGSSAPVKDIAFECGFKSPMRFASEFKKKEGASPRQFRRIAGREKP